MEKLCHTDAVKFDSLIAGSAGIAIISHTHPDGDAIGGCVAMKSFIDSFYGIPATIVVANRENRSVSFLLEDPDECCYAEENPSKAKAIVDSAGLIVCLDFNYPARAGAVADLLRESTAPKVLFDHHLNPDTDYFDITVSSCNVSSTCEILYKSLKSMPCIGGEVSRLPLRCLTAIMTGITTDTNNFSNSTFPETFTVTSEMLSAGVDRNGILLHIYNEYRENRIRLMGHLLADEMKITPLGVAYIILSDETAASFDINDDELEGLVNIPLGIKSVKISIFVRSDDGFLRVSLRSKRGTSANAVAARYFHGGGHELASGGKLFYPQDITEKKDAAAYIEKVTAEYFKAEGDGCAD